MTAHAVASLVPGERVAVRTRPGVGRVAAKRTGKALVKFHENTPDETALWFPAAELEFAP